MGARLAVISTTVVALLAGLLTWAYWWLTPYLEDGLLDALQKGHCYDPKQPGPIARDWLGVRPEESLDLFLRQFIDAYGTYDPSLLLHTPVQQVFARVETWEFTRVCVIGGQPSRAGAELRLYYEDGTSLTAMPGDIWSDAGSSLMKLSYRNWGWLSDQSLAFYRANPRYGKTTFFR